MTSYIIFAFVSGFLLATVIFWIATKQLQKDWQAEYRRLMGGIKAARENVLDVNVTRASVSEYLRKVYSNEIFWPRG